MADEDIGIPNMYPKSDNKNNDSDDDDNNFFGGNRTHISTESSMTPEDRISMLEKTVNDLLDTHTELIRCCSEAEDRMRRLETHASTLRSSILNLTTKIDVQTGYSRYR
ncbi:IMV surface protein [Sea otter poxvirus]|uniref:IMV surface protein n=1 Tax=Sea otter poxvirus TaxID=1416741 RepID=A0A2U9QHW2_9POXV|nr:IMV surface protein [Sea otter poxvirus]AWU47162.1 IMV surface protein [Sea otter poxvirus]